MLQQGDNVFFSDNSRGMTDYMGVAFRTIEALGLTPFVYGGIGLDVRKSKIDREIRDDFYQSRVVVLLLGTGQGWSSIEDNWVIPELEHAILLGIVCFVYVTAETTEEYIQSLSLPVEVIKVRDKDHFETSLRQNLEQLMVAS